MEVIRVEYVLRDWKFLWDCHVMGASQRRYCLSRMTQGNYPCGLGSSWGADRIGPMRSSQGQERRLTKSWRATGNRREFVGCCRCCWTRTVPIPNLDSSTLVQPCRQKVGLVNADLKTSRIFSCFSSCRSLDSTFLTLNDAMLDLILRCLHRA